MSQEDTYALDLGYWERNILFEILVKEPTFLITFTNYVYANNTRKSKFGYDSMNLVWQINNIEIILEEVFDIIDKIKPYYINDDYCNSFFCNIPDESKKQAEDFLVSYCTKNYNNSNKINIVVDIVRNTFKELYDKITPMEPKNLAIKMNLTNEALRYAILGDVDGNMFDKNKDVYSLSAEFANPYGMMGRTVVTGKILNSSEESFNEIMNNVKDICDMYEKVTKGF